MKKKHISLSLILIGMILFILSMYAVFYIPIGEGTITDILTWVGVVLIIIGVLTYKRLKKR